HPAPPLPRLVRTPVPLPARRRPPLLSRLATRRGGAGRRDRCRPATRAGRPDRARHAVAVLPRDRRFSGDLPPLPPAALPGASRAGRACLRRTPPASASDDRRARARLFPRPRHLAGGALLDPPAVGARALDRRPPAAGFDHAAHRRRPAHQPALRLLSALRAPWAGGPHLPSRRRRPLVRRPARRLRFARFRRECHPSRRRPLALRARPPPVRRRRLPRGGPLARMVPPARLLRMAGPRVRRRPLAGRARVHDLPARRGSRRIRLAAGGRAGGTGAPTPRPRGPPRPPAEGGRPTTRAPAGRAGG